MVVWRITGNEIGPNGNGACFFEKKSDAMKALREYRRGAKQSGEIDGTGPDEVVIRNRAELVDALHDAMGYGAS